MSDRQEWRVVLETGVIHDVVVTVHANGSCHAEYGAADQWRLTLRSAVLELARDFNWPIAEVLAPGVPTREEALAELRRELADAHALNNYPDDF